MSSYVKTESLITRHYGPNSTDSYWESLISNYLGIRMLSSCGSLSRPFTSPMFQNTTREFTEIACRFFFASEWLTLCFSPRHCPWLHILYARSTLCLSMGCEIA
ncbi:hypothetical protein M758_UG025500 [Ceratodon purpureus]|nr:hypothetical protein M758_UG025500 [Ceratodon purpureus]